MVAAKCPNCGANIEVDANSKAGICQYCGCAFVTQDAIVNYNTTIINNNNITADTVNIVGGNFDNLMKVAIDSLESNDYKMAYEYFSKAAEIDPLNTKCILYRSLAYGFSSTIEDSTGFYSMLSTFKRELIDNTITDTQYISHLLTTFIKLINNISSSVTNFYTSNNNVSKEDIKYCNVIYRNCANACDMPTQILKKYDIIEPNKEIYISALKTHVFELTLLAVKKTYLYGYANGQPWYKHYREKNEEDTKRIEELTTEIQKYEPDYEPVEIGGGCYIATCVYGSYDCPQVWTLRRYRDETLGSTWYGRTFIRIYYALSPTLVKLFGNKKWFKEFWLKKLNKKVEKLQNNGVESTPYNDIDWRKK